jgi:hypothetical protein
VCVCVCVCVDVGMWGCFSLPSSFSLLALICPESFSPTSPCAQSLSVSVSGVPGELVTVNVLSPNRKVVSVACTIPASSKARVTVTAQTSQCVPL